MGTNATGWAKNFYGCPPKQASGCPSTPHNCTLYVAFRLMQNGVMNLKWHDQAPKWAADADAHGTTVNQTPAVGSIAQWNAGIGHVAYVEAIDATGITLTMDDFSTAQITPKYPVGYTARVHIVNPATLPNGLAGSPAWPDNFIHFTDIATPHTWSIVADPMPTGSTSNQLSSVSCPTANLCFGVGYAEAALIERWNGTSWNVVPSPHPAGSVLSGVSCPSETSCVAVGYVYTGTGKATLIERWDGTSWVIMPSPAVASTGAELRSVSCADTTSCVAIGSYRVGSTTTRTLIERWSQGSTWSQMPSPNPAGAVGSFLLGVSCPNATTCISVGSSGNQRDYTGPIGNTLIERWSQGSDWSIVVSPKAGKASGLTSVSCATGADCFAVGFNATPSGSLLIEHLSGTVWTITASPNPTNRGLDAFSGVACASSTACVAVGFNAVSGAQTVRTLIEGFDGSSWKLDASPNVAHADNYLNSVSCPPAGSSCFGVGNLDPFNASPAGALLIRGV